MLSSCETEDRSVAPNASGIPCPNCGYPESGVVDSRANKDYIRRRRVCDRCGTRFRTHERLDPDWDENTCTAIDLPEHKTEPVLLRNVSSC